MNNRNTIQRFLVLETVKELQCHATADEVYDAIAKQHPGISRATVYRNLNRLSETGDIRKLELPNGADRYDPLCHSHYHARCVRCNKIFDVKMEFMENLEKSVKDTRGFVFTGHDIIFKGICLECNK